MLLLGWCHHPCSRATVFPPSPTARRCTAGAHACPMKGAHREKRGYGTGEWPREAGVLLRSPDSHDGDNILISVSRGGTWPLSCSKAGGQLQHGHDQRACSPHPSADRPLIQGTSQSLAHPRQKTRRKTGWWLHTITPI